MTKLEQFFSHERLANYMSICGGNRDTALRLYNWNVDMSEAFYIPLQTLEITFRNSVQANLTEKFGEKWFENEELGLDDYATSKITDSLKGRKSINQLLEKQVISEIPFDVTKFSFGFWVSLIGSGGLWTLKSKQNGDSSAKLERATESLKVKANYEMTLWRPALRYAFPHVNVLNRRDAHSQFNEMKILRNRVAHYEPIHTRNLKRDNETILRLLDWMSPEAYQWCEYRSRVPRVLERGEEFTKYLKPQSR